MTTPRLAQAADLPQLVVSNQVEPTAAAIDDVVFYTESIFHQVSSDGGATFGPRIRTNTSFERNDGDLRRPQGDESTIFLPLVDRFVWAMLFTEANTGLNILRLAFTSTENVRSGGDQWSYLDLQTAGLARAGYSFDYPQLAITPGHLYVTANLVNAATQQASQIVLRFPISSFRDLGAHQIGFQYFLDNSASFFGPVQSCVSEFLWVQHRNQGLLRVWSWDEAASGTISSCDIEIPQWSNTSADYSSIITADRTDWISIPGRAIDARPVGTMADNDPIIAWHAARIPGGRPPQPFIYLLHLTPTGDRYQVAGTRYIWNPDLAFAFPSLATLDGRLAMNCAFGGGAQFPTPLMGFLDLPFSHSSAFAQIVPSTSDAGVNRWGDYVTLRPWYRTRDDKSQLAATTYTINKTATATMATPHFYGLSY